jgi:hypothetical protein
LILVLLNFEKVIDSVTVENIYIVMLQTLVIQGAFTKVEIGKKKWFPLEQMVGLCLLDSKLVC